MPQQIMSLIKTLENVPAEISAEFHTIVADIEAAFAKLTGAKAKVAPEVAAAVDTHVANIVTAHLPTPVAASVPADPAKPAEVPAAPAEAKPAA